MIKKAREIGNYKKKIKVDIIINIISNNKYISSKSRV